MPQIPNPVPDADPAKIARILLGIPDAASPALGTHDDHMMRHTYGPSETLPAPNAVSVLFVGGSHDALRMPVPDDVRRVKLGVPGTTPVVETDYQRHVLVLQDRTRLRIFAPIGLTQDDVLRELVKHYRTP